MLPLPSSICILSSAFIRRQPISESAYFRTDSRITRTEPAPLLLNKQINIRGINNTWKLWWLRMPFELEVVACSECSLQFVYLNVSCAGKI